MAREVKTRLKAWKASILTSYEELLKFIKFLEKFFIFKSCIIIAEAGFNGLSVYVASKAGLSGFTKSLARELGRGNITVNCVAPGFMATDMTSGLVGEAKFNQKACPTWFSRYNRCRWSSFLSTFGRWSDDYWSNYYS